MKRYKYKIFIVSHGRPDRVYTYATLLDYGIDSNNIAIVVDDSDSDLNIKDYKSKFAEVYIMQNNKITLDTMDNIGDKKSVVYKRKFCYELAEKLGYRYFLVLDDDYTNFYSMFKAGEFVSFGSGDKLKNKLNDIICYYFSLLDLNKNIKAIAMGQSGDFYCKSFPLFPRKVMNSWFCDVQKKIEFKGRFNDDVNTYLINNKIGNICISSLFFALKQKDTQKNKGGMTEAYLNYGTYVKSFYSVICSPSSVVVEFNKHVGRIHHKINHKFNDVRIIDAD